MQLTLGECARQLGISKGTISKAISSGKLSAGKREDGSFAIDASELARYREVNGHRFKPAQTETSVEMVEIRARAELAEQRLADLKVMVEDLKAQRDRWQEQASRLAISSSVADPKQAEPVAKRSWWNLRRAG